MAFKKKDMLNLLEELTTPEKFTGFIDKNKFNWSMSNTPIEGVRYLYCPWCKATSPTYYLGNIQEIRVSHSVMLKLSTHDVTCPWRKTAEYLQKYYDK